MIDLAKKLARKMQKCTKPDCTLTRIIVFTIRYYPFLTFCIFVTREYFTCRFPRQDKKTIAPKPNVRLQTSTLMPCTQYSCRDRNKNKVQTRVSTYSVMILSRMRIRC